jgi:mRNA degradation ribonuclease J1/J2
VVEYARSNYNDLLKKRFETKEIMRTIRDNLAEFMMKKVGREPLVIPMYVYIGKDGIAMKEISTID